MDTQISLPFSHTFRKLPQINLAVPTKSFTPFPGRPFILRPFFCSRPIATKHCQASPKSHASPSKAGLGWAPLEHGSQESPNNISSSRWFFVYQESYSSTTTTTSRPWNSWVVTCWFKLLFLGKNRIYIAFTWSFRCINLSVGQAAKFSNSQKTFSKCCFLFPNLFLWKPINKTPLDLWLFWGPSPNSIHHDVVRLLLEAPSPDAMILEDSPLSEG